MTSESVPAAGDQTTADRLTKLRAAMRAHSLDAIAVVPGANLGYLSGIASDHVSIRLTVAFFPTDGTPALVVPALEVPGMRAHMRVPFKLYPWDDAAGPTGALERCIADLHLDRAGWRIGIENTVMRVFELRAIEAAAPGIHVADATPVLAAMRMVKDVDELAAMRVAVHAIEEALRSTIAQIRAGMTERELADIRERNIRAAGSAPSFTAIVASGPNAANPHHHNSDRAFQPGDMIILDGGALHKGYASDITRTVALGNPGPEARAIYDLVLAANAAGRAAVHPGASGEEIDRAARAVIEAGGYGPQFLHRTGHGLGLAIHEPPFIVAGSREPLAAGTTFTIEPGIYVDGLGGVRIEDNVVITADGGESLTSFERELIIVKG